MATMELLDLPCLGLDSLPDSDFLAFLGDLTDPVLDLPAEAAAALDPTPTSATTGLLPPWQQQAQVNPTASQPSLKQAPHRQQRASSPCSSAASAEATHCPDSPTMMRVVGSSSPASSEEAGHHPAPAPTTRSSKRQRSSKAATPAPSATATTSSDHPGEDSQEQEGAASGQQLTKAQLAAAKRRAPVVDWRAIDDPEERRKQRRLAKNRVTAARSRERKKEQMVEMETRLSQLEADNSSLRTLLQTVMAENTGLKEQLLSLTRGTAAAPAAHEGSPKPAVLVKCLAIMHLVCCLLMCAEASLTLVLPLLSRVLQQQEQRCAVVVASSCAASAAASSCGSSAASSCGSCADSCPPGGGVAAREWWRVRLRPTSVLHV